MIMKLLLVVGVIAIVYFLFIKKKPTAVKKPKDNSKKEENKNANEMIECASCGIYCEIDNAILSGSKYYCSSECVNKG